MKKSSVVLLAILSAGCAAPGHLTTPSGTPEVTVHVSAREAQKESMHWLLSHGFEVGNPPDATREIVQISGHHLEDGGNKNTWITFNYFSADSATTTIYAKKLIWYRFTGNRPQTSQADFEELQNDLQEIASSLKQR
jgi:hypothetical protein